MKKIIVISLVIVSGIAAGASAADCITNWDDLKAFQRGWPENSFREFAKLAAKWGQKDPLCNLQRDYERTYKAENSTPARRYMLIVSRFGGHAKYQQMKTRVETAVGGNKFTFAGIYEDETITIYNIIDNFLSDNYLM